MKISDVTNAPIYGIQAGYAVKNEIAKNTADAKKTTNPREVKEAKDAKEETKKKASSAQVNPSEPQKTPINTKILFSRERDLNIIITRVMDVSTNKVIHQIPAEETIKRLKLKYQQSLAQKGTSANDVVV
ncbi:MAG: flagellar protein FlaG [Planctomycetota bacterium]